MTTKHQTCKGTTKAGKRCQSPFVDSDGYCPAHGVDGTARMRQRGQRGGAATKKRYGGDGLPREQLGDLETIHDAQRWLRLIAVAVGERELTYSEGQAMTSAVREWIKGEDTRLRAEDLQELREQLADLRRKGVRAV